LAFVASLSPRIGCRWAGPVALQLNRWLISSRSGTNASAGRRIDVTEHRTSKHPTSNKKPFLAG
jgi:hypothetical protein